MKTAKPEKLFKTNDNKPVSDVLRIFTNQKEYLLTYTEMAVAAVVETVALTEGLL